MHRRFTHVSAREFGIVSVSVLTELLKTLVGKEILTPGDVRHVLHRAIQETSGINPEPGKRAGSLIESELLPKFSEGDGSSV
jgi:hypothetical protein